MPSARILCVGALTMDTVFRMERLPDGPGKFLPTEVVDVAAGMASSAATSVARLGGDVALWASVGDDAAGTRLIADMEADAIDCSLVRTVVGARSAIAIILLDPVGERMIIPYYSASLLKDPVEPRAIAAGAFGVVMSDVRWPAAGAMALATARRVGVHGVLDADVAARETLDLLVPLASHVVASRSGAALITGHADAERSAELLAGMFASEIVVTAGEEGSYWFDRGADAVRHVPAPHVDAVDTTAAGDVFHGAYALGLSEGKAGEDLLRFASAAAAIKCTRFGGRLGAPNRAETDAMVARTYP